MKDPNAVALGRKGGQSTLRKYGKKHFKEMIERRWSKKRNAENTEKRSS